MYEKRFDRDCLPLTKVEMVDNDYNYNGKISFDHRGLILSSHYSHDKITYAVPNLEFRRPVQVECTFKPVDRYSDLFIKVNLLGYSITI